MLRSLGLDLRIAFRNVVRQRRRSGLTLLSIITGTVALIVFGGFIDYTFWGLRESTIRTQMGHIQVYKEGYQEKGGVDPLAYGIEDPDAVAAALAEVPGVALVSPSVKFSGLLRTERTSVYCSVEGMDPDRAAERASFLNVVDGAGLSKYAPDGGMLGRGLAAGIGAEVGDRLTMLATTRDGETRTSELEVRGVFETGFRDYDNIGVILPIAHAQALVQTSDAMVITLMLEDTDATEEVAGRVQALFAQRGWALELATWEDLAVFYHKVVQLYGGMFTFVRAIIAIIVVFSIVNTLSMTVMERVGEIGTLRAIGLTRRRIRRLFILEGGILGILGGALGVIAGVAVAVLLSMEGLDIPPPPGQSKGYTARINIVPAVLASSFLLAFGSAVISSILPARRASNMAIVDAIRHQ
jgi:putative ABC transport system permease protein